MTKYCAVVYKSSKSGTWKVPACGRGWATASYAIAKHSDLVHVQAAFESWTSRSEMYKLVEFESDGEET
jgi:hypothetical protein